MNFIVDFGIRGDVSWCLFANRVVLFLYMPFIHFLLEKKKRKKVRKIKKNGKSFLGKLKRN